MPDIPEPKYLDLAKERLAQGVLFPPPGAAK